jgi:hypothetical protein
LDHGGSARHFAGGAPFPTAPPDRSGASASANGSFRRTSHLSLRPIVSTPLPRGAAGEGKSEAIEAIMRVVTDRTTSERRNAEQYAPDASYSFRSGAVDLIPPACVSMVMQRFDENVFEFGRKHPRKARMAP